MNMDNKIAIIGIIVVLIGWLYNGYANREHEIFKKRLDYRLAMLESYKETAVSLEKLLNNGNQSLADEFIKNLEKSQADFLLYGTKKEIELINKITQYASKNEHSKMKDASAELMKLVRDNLRSALGLKSI